jgi:hypothetical protein
MSLFNMAFHLYNCQGDRSCRSWKYRRCCKRPSRSPLSECFSTQLECSVRISGTDRKNECPSWRKESPRQPSRWLRALVATRFHLPRIDFHRTALSSAAERSHLVSHLHKLGRSSQPFHPTQAEEPQPWLSPCFGVPEIRILMPLLDQVHLARPDIAMTE